MRRPYQVSPDHADAAASAATERAFSFLAGAATLHPATMQGTLTIKIDERMLLLGPITTPTDVTIRVEGIMRTL